MFGWKAPPPARTFVGGGGLVVSGTSDPIKQAQIERGDLLLTLENVVRCVVEVATSGRGMVMGDTHRETIELCTALYRMMTHHLKDASLPPQGRLAQVWEYIHTHESAFPMNMVTMVLNLDHVHTSHGMLKGFIRLALNQGKMHTVLDALHRVIAADQHSIFSPLAFMGSSNAVSEAARILELLVLPERVTFLFSVDHIALDKQAQSAPSAPVPMTRSPSRPPTEQSDSVGPSRTLPEVPVEQAPVLSSSPKGEKKVKKVKKKTSMKDASDEALAQNIRSVSPVPENSVKEDSPPMGTPPVKKDVIPRSTVDDIVNGISAKLSTSHLSTAAVPIPDHYTSTSSQDSFPSSSFDESRTPNRPVPLVFGVSKSDPIIPLPKVQPPLPAPTPTTSSPVPSRKPASPTESPIKVRNTTPDVMGSDKFRIGGAESTQNIRSVTPTRSASPAPAAALKKKVSKPNLPPKSSGFKYLTQPPQPMDIRLTNRRKLRNSSIGATTTRLVVIPVPRTKSADACSATSISITKRSLATISPSELSNLGLFYTLQKSPTSTTLHQRRWRNHKFHSRQERWTWARKRYSNKLWATATFRFAVTTKDSRFQKAGGIQQVSSDDSESSTPRDASTTNRQVSSGDVFADRLIRLHYDLHMEYTLHSPEFTCFGCGNVTRSSRARFCEYTGKHFCETCHMHDERVLPSLIVRNWDFRPRKVCILARQFLDEIVDKPCIDMRQCRPRVVANATLKKLMEAREILSIQTQFVLSCRESQVGKLMAMAGKHIFLLATEPHMFTMQSLILAHQGAFLNVLRDLVTKYTQHITVDCEVCKAKGSYCEATTDGSCNSLSKNDIIFPFSIDATRRCPSCNAVFHASCFRGVDHCPKCQRRQKLLNARQKQRP